MEPDNNVNVQRPEFGQMIDMNLSPWTQFYPPGMLVTFLLICLNQSCLIVNESIAVTMYRIVFNSKWPDADGKPRRASIQ